MGGHSLDLFPFNDQQRSIFTLQIIEMSTLQIMPPDLMTGGATKGTDKKPFDSMEFLPNKLTSGESNEVRLLGTYDSGHIEYCFRCPTEEKQGDGTLRFSGYGYSKDYNGFPDAARATDWASPDRRKLDEQVKPKRCLAVLLYNYTTDRVEVGVFEQKSIRDAIVEICGDEDYSWDDNSIATFTMKVGRQGEGLETSYSCLPKAGKKVEAKVIKAFNAVKETSQMSLLLEGKHPLRKPAAEFSSDSSDDAEF